MSELSAFLLAVAVLVEAIVLMTVCYRQLRIIQAHNTFVLFMMDEFNITVDQVNKFIDTKMNL